MRFQVTIAALIVWFSTTVALAATSPMEAVKTTADGVLSTLRDPGLKSKREARREQIKGLLRARFDFDEMAKRSLGANWSKRTPEEQQQFVSKFSDLLINTYVDRMEDYQGEKIVYGRERRDGDQATVDTKVVDQKGVEHSLNYSLKLNGDWKVYDVVIEDVSIVNNYRSQFNRVLSKSSFAELLQTMSSKSFQAPGSSS